MSDIDELNRNGLYTKDNEQLVSDLQNSLQNLYSQDGEVLNFDSNTPDGQLIQIMAALGTVLRELLTDVYNSIDPDKCVGSVQDNRYQINYLTRNGGAFTLQKIAITANKTIVLQGLDDSFNDENASAYAVSDDIGNVWYLVSSTTIYAGTTSLEFRAATRGPIIPTIGTITNQVTIEQGVTSVINNVGATSIGYERESDSDFRIRRNRSTGTRSENNFDTIWANLSSLDGVTDINGWQNNSSSTDANGVPAHSIWFIVEGGNSTEIAETIYANLGGSGTYTAGLVGTTHTVTITTASLQALDIHYDEATVVPLYIQFDLQVITELGEINQSDIKTFIANNLTYKIGENAETSKVTEVCASAMIADGGNGYALNVQLSLDGTTWVDYIEVASIADKLTPDTSRIIINVVE